MGSFFSTLLNPDPAAAAEESSAVAAVAAVAAVHSMETWNKHWTDHNNSDKLLVIDFYATWCGPCRIIEPAFKALATRFTQASFVKIDVDELSEVAQLWKVQAMPTFVFVKGGREVSRVLGSRKDELESTVARLV